MRLRAQHTWRRDEFPFVSEHPRAARPQLNLQ
jgi:hypothetical protein